MKRPIHHPLWPGFIQFGQLIGVDMMADDRWGTWWGCFCAGATAALRDIRTEALRCRR